MNCRSASVPLSETSCIVPPVDCPADCSQSKTVQLTKIVAGKLQTELVCGECPKLQLGAATPAEPQAKSAFSLKSFLAGIAPAKQPTKQAQPAPVACDACGITFDEFRSSGRLGCYGDYEAFRVQLLPLLRKIHGSVRHVGRVPARIGERLERDKLIESLEEQLQTAVQSEAYERAAELRDQLNALKG